MEMYKFQVFVELGRSGCDIARRSSTAPIIEVR